MFLRGFKFFAFARGDLKNKSDAERHARSELLFFRSDPAGSAVEAVEERRRRRAEPSRVIKSEKYTRNFQKKHVPGVLERSKCHI